jgi:hypothetical protein
VDNANSLAYPLGYQFHVVIEISHLPFPPNHHLYRIERRKGKLNVIAIHSITAKHNPSLSAQSTNAAKNPCCYFCRSY